MGADPELRTLLVRVKTESVKDKNLTASFPWTLSWAM
jgi:hypothetical protein